MHKKNIIIHLTLVLFVIVPFLQLYSQSKDSTSLFTDLKTEQTKIGNESSVKMLDTFELVPADKFVNADMSRYTIDGNLPYEHTHIKPLNASIIAGSLTAIFVVQHEMQQNTIWKKTGPFNFAEDGHWTAYLDKGGHFFGTYLPSYIFSETLMTSGLSWDMSVIIGSSLGLAYTSYVEILDGFSQGFGFSPSDFYADLAGAGFFLAQHYVPVLQNFSPKFMYVRPAWIGERNRAEAETFIDDYSSQVFWMSINVHNLLPTDFKKYWPTWLELSVGYAVYSLCAGSEVKCYPQSEYISKDVWGNRKVIISLDYNLVKMLPDGGSFWNWFKQSLNHVKLPAPAIEIGKNSTRFSLLYPFKF
jgi:hypothetical protein